MTLEDQRFTTPLLFMFGLKAINYYMLVERDRWMGSPLTAHNKIRHSYFDFYRHWNSFLKKNQFHEWSLQSDLLILANYDTERILKALKAVEGHPIHFLPEEIGYAESPSLFQYRLEEEHPRWSANQWAYALNRHLPVHCSDTVAPFEKLMGHQAAWVATFEIMDKTAQKNLRRFAEEGGTVILGPLAPSLDENARPFTCFAELQSFHEAKVGKGKLVLLPEWNERKIEAVLAAAGIQPVMDSLPPEILTTRFTRDGKELFFFANPSNQAVSFKPTKKLTPLYGMGDGKVAHEQLNLQPWSVSVWGGLT